jgi:hypothetical protein
MEKEREGEGKLRRYNVSKAVIKGERERLSVGELVKKEDEVRFKEEWIERKRERKREKERERCLRWSSQGEIM